MTDPQPKTLSLPVRRVVACIGIVVFLIFYVALVSNVGQALPAHPVIQVLFYALAGTLWGIPVIPIISWSENYRKRQK